MNEPVPRAAPLPFRLPPLSLGCWAFAGGAPWGPADDEVSIATIHGALDHGITAFDTAPAYGDGASEELVGRALIGRRDQAQLLTKVSASSFSAERVRTSCEASLRRLRTDHIDLLQIHWVGEEANFDDVIATFNALHDAGKILACGVCNFGPAHLARLPADDSRWHTHQLPYNLLWRAIESEVAPLSRARGLGMLAYSPLQQGLLGGRYRRADDVPAGRTRSRHFRGDREGSRHGGPGFETETFTAIDAIDAVAQRLERPMSHVALAWLLQQPGVASVLVGARTRAQIVENVAALDLSLDADTLRELDRVTRPLHTLLGPDPDMWAPKSRYR
mgnify:CR=1 FL=1